MRNVSLNGLSSLHSELELLEAETFEITDNVNFDETVMASTTTSTTSSCTSTSGTSCCN